MAGMRGLARLHVTESDRTPAHARAVGTRRLKGLMASDPRHRSMRALPQDHPLVPLLRHAPDFQDEAAIADALLNPHDRPYSGAAAL